MNPCRRNFLSRVVGWAAVSFFSLPAYADWPKAIFSITELDKTIADITGGAGISESDVELEVPRVAENGGQVRVGVKTSLDKVDMINILVEKNPVPLTSRFMFTEYNKPEVAVNVKVRETSDIIALVKADGKFYSARRKVQVTAGGCG